MKEIKTLIIQKLRVIDLRNEQTKGLESPMRIVHELTGIKQALYALGMELQMNVNPYYHENKEASSFTITVI